MTEQYDLVRCPFCYSSKATRTQNEDGMYAFACNRCGATGPTTVSVRAAKAAWNERALKVSIEAVGNPMDGPILSRIMEVATTVTVTIGGDTEFVVYGTSELRYI